MAKKVKEWKEGVDNIDNIDQIESILNEKPYKDLHLGSRSGDEIIKPDIISTGSFIFDGILGGGFRSSSWSRFYAAPEHGKTAQGLKWGTQWQKYYDAKNEPNMVVFFNAEGRISPDLIIRSGINTAKNKFRIIDSNNADFIYTVVERLIINNDNDIRYFIIVDSTDACIRSCDLGKDFSEAEKIGGTATILSAAGKRLSLLFNRKNHHLYITSQIRESLKSGKGASGGNAPKFYSSLTAKIIKHWSKFSILENPSDLNSKEIGRKAQFDLEKTYNETSGVVVEIPILYGRIGGIWHEYEARIVAKEWQFLTEGHGGRFQFSEQFCQELIENNISFEEKFHGEKKIRDYFDSNQELVNYIFDRIRKLRGF